MSNQTNQISTNTNQTNTNNTKNQQQDNEEWQRLVHENLEKNEAQRKSSSGFFHLEPGQHATLEFTGEFGPVWKDFNQDGKNERLVYEYHIIEEGSEQFGPKTWDLSKRWSEIVDHYLKQGVRILKVERQGAGIHTMYYFTPVSTASTPAAGTA
jgi:hypothetical protein